MVNKKTLLKIKKFAVKEDWDKAFGGKSKGNLHLLRTLKLADFLAKKSKANALIVKAGALLHDVPLVYGKDFGYKKNRKIIKDVLQRFELTELETEKIIECVASHEGTVKPKTLEAKVVHDADVLEKSGVLGVIRHAWKLTNLKKDSGREITNVDVQKIIDHLLWRGKQVQTPIAKTINQYLNNSLRVNNIGEIVKETSKLAKQGIITEKIATSLFKKLSAKERKKLKSQLDLSYLKKFQ